MECAEEAATIILLQKKLPFGLKILLLPHQHHSIEQKLDLSKRICERYSAGIYTIASCVENEGISDKTFLRWASEIPEISDAYKEAQRKSAMSQRTQLKLAALSSLKKLVDGQTVEEIHQEGTPIYDKHGEQIGMKTKSVKRITKHYQPNVTAVIFSLKSLDPSTFKDNVPEQENQEQVFLINGKEIKF